MHIAGAPAVECESRDVYHWCTHYRIQVDGCVSLVLPLWDASPGMYIVGAPTVESESRDVYRWCAHCRM